MINPSDFVETVRKAAAKTQIKIRRSCEHCPLYVCNIAEGWDKEGSLVTFAGKIFGEGTNWGWGVVEGFDNTQYVGVCRNVQGYLNGYECGLAAREEFLPKESEYF